MPSKSLRPETDQSPKIWVLITLICLLRLSNGSTMLSYKKLARGVKIERNLLVFSKIRLPFADYSIRGLEDEYVRMERERRLQITSAPEFRDNLKKAIFKVMNGDGCSLRYGGHRFFREVLAHRLAKSLEKEHLDKDMFKKALKALGRLARKKSRLFLGDDEKKVKQGLKADKEVNKSFKNLIGVVLDGVKNRLKEGVVKTKEYSERRLQKIIVSHFKRLCFRDSLNEKGRSLRLADYFLRSELGRDEGETDGEKSKKKTWSGHEKELMKRVGVWSDSGALDREEVAVLSRTMKQLLLRLLNKKMVEQRREYMRAQGEIGGFGGPTRETSLENLQKLITKMDSLKNSEKIDRESFLKSMKQETGEDSFLVANDRVFLEFTKNYGREHFKNFRGFSHYFRSFLRSLRAEQMTSADQSNEIINSARKLYLRDQIDRKKFKYSLLKKGVLLDLKARQDERLHWKLFENILKQNLRRFGGLLDGDGKGSKKSWKKKKGLGRSLGKAGRKERKRAIKGFYRGLDSGMSFAVASGILPKRFVKINLNKLKRQATNEVKERLKDVKNAKDLGKIKMGQIMGQSGRILERVQRQGRSYKHILLTSMLNKKKSYNAR